MNKFFKIVGQIIMVLSVVGFCFEASDTSPLWHQLALWGGCIVFFLIGEDIYQRSGGEWRHWFGD